MDRQIALLEPLLTEARAARMRQVLSTRSDHVAFVFERMIDPHNLSAALRSLEAMSFQDAHIVLPGERLELSRGITIGAERWLTLHTHQAIAGCMKDLRGAGFRVYVSDLGEGQATALREIDFSHPTALVFGNEHLGVSGEALEHADRRFRIDMLGFAQSFNLSVAVALSAYQARREMERIASAAGEPERFLLAPQRRRALYAQWLRSSVRNAEQILAEAGLDGKGTG